MYICLMPNKLIVYNVMLLKFVANVEASFCESLYIVQRRPASNLVRTHVENYSV